MNNFYSHLQSFANLRDLLTETNYVEAPRDWHIVIADVTNSTRAIEAGKYKDVNFIGAACIVAVTNSLKGDDIPFVFGGDGASFLVPPHRLADAKAALLGLAAVAKRGYDLHLRIGSVSLALIARQHLEVKVAKYQISKGNFLAMFRGGGVAYAESLIKQNRQYLVDPLPEQDDVDFSGLSCRWQPCQSRNGKILSLLVMATDQAPSTTYDDVIAFIYPRKEVRERSPVTAESAVYTWPAAGVRAEARLHSRGRDSWWRITLIIIETFGLHLALKFGLSTHWFNPKTYRKEIVTHTDFLKFDDCLRMVIDCSEEQIAAILAFLSKLKEDKRLVFGIHISDAALMTCLVRKTTSGDHVHFIDGADGGYAVAAKMLKEQFQTAALQPVTEGARR